MKEENVLKHPKKPL